jgi:hypothetical protein
MLDIPDRRQSVTRMTAKQAVSGLVLLAIARLRRQHGTAAPLNKGKNASGCVWILPAIASVADPFLNSCNRGGCLVEITSVFGNS